MSGNLSRLKFASVEPPPFVWERIERKLNSDKVPEEFTCFSKLHDCAIAPPPDVKDRLFEELDLVLQRKPLFEQPYQPKKNSPGKIHFPVVKKSKTSSRIYWGMTGIILASALIFSYFILNSGVGEAEKPSVKKPAKNESGSFIPTSVSGKMSGEISF